IERAAEFLVEHRARQIVAALRAAAEKEPAAHLLVRLVDRDVLAGHLRVADKKPGRRQSAKSSTDDMRSHRLSSRTPWRPNHPITGTAGWRCARAMRGHTAAAQPTSVMNSRRFMCAPLSPGIAPYHSGEEMPRCT